MQCLSFSSHWLQGQQYLTVTRSVLYQTLAFPWNNQTGGTCLFMWKNDYRVSNKHTNCQTPSNIVCAENTIAVWLEGSLLSAKGRVHYSAELILTASRSPVDLAWDTDLMIMLSSKNMCRSHRLVHLSFWIWIWNLCFSTCMKVTSMKSKISPEYELVEDLFFRLPPNVGQTIRSQWLGHLSSVLMLGAYWPLTGPPICTGPIKRYVTWMTCCSGMRSSNWSSPCHSL